MIENETQYRVTLNWLRRFKASKETLTKMRPDDNVHPLLHQANIDALDSFIPEFEKDIEDYQARLRKEILAMAINESELRVGLQPRIFTAMEEYAEKILKLKW